MTIANTIQRMTISFLEQSTQNKWSNEENSGKKKTACDFVCQDLVVQHTDLSEFMKTGLANIL